MTTSDETGAFCHDHIEHPLMWCDEKRRLVERKNAEESLRMWRRRKTEEMARKEKEKQEVSICTNSSCHSRYFLLLLFRFETF